MINWVLQLNIGQLENSFNSHLEKHLNLCEIVDVEPKSQCRACLTYWSAGIVYCTCGHLMKDDTTENKKYISSVLDLFSIPNFYIRKGLPHGSQVRKETWLQRIPHGKSTSKKV